MDCTVAGTIATWDCVTLHALKELQPPSNKMNTIDPRIKVMREEPQEVKKQCTQIVRFA